MKRLEQGLSAWQLTMMALGCVIGGSFFLGSAVGVHAAGPSILLAFAFGGLLVYFILTALSEMTVANPQSGSFRAFASQEFGQGSGFVVGWVYWTGMVLAMSSEATAVSILIRSWIPSLPIWLLSSGLIVAVSLINLMGAHQLSKLESGLAFIKIFAVLSFIIIGLALIIGLFPHTPAVGLGSVTQEPFFAGGFKSLAGCMLIVMFTYAGFEIIGLASSEAKDPQKTIPKAIRYTVIGLVSLYMISHAVLLPLIPTANISPDTSPIVAALNRQNITWAGSVINAVLITAILSTMLASMFGIGRMMRSLAEDKLAPKFLKDHTDVPYRGILFSGFAMLWALWFGMLFPSVYLFLISSGGFAILFSYVVIMMTHIRFRRKHGCPPDGKCQMKGFPISSFFTLFALIAAIISMPFVEGQTSGLIAGSLIVAFYSLCYLLLWVYQHKEKLLQQNLYQRQRLQTEFSEDLTEGKTDNPTEDDH